MTKDDICVSPLKKDFYVNNFRLLRTLPYIRGCGVEDVYYGIRLVGSRVLFVFEGHCTSFIILVLIFGIYHHLLFIVF